MSGRSRRGSALAFLLFAVALALVAPGAAHASAGGDDPLTPVLFTIVLVLVAARAGSEVAARLGQPEVLGELVAGIVIGNLGLAGIHRLEYLKTDAPLEVLAGLGLVLLLFEVGLESTVRDMLKVGGSSLLVATLGVIVPALLGWGVGAWLLPGRPLAVHLFLGATLSATSVGITARVLQDLGRSRDKEARIILGAAVIDDLLGLILLAVVAGLVRAADSGTQLSIGEVARITGTAAGFVFGAIGIGVLATPRLIRVAGTLKSRGILQATALVFCFLLAGLSGLIGLAPIVGAFAAGLLLEDVQFKSFSGRGEHPLGEAVHPLISWLAPFFFVHMGTSVDLASFGRMDALGLALALTVAAVIGKQVCGLGVLEPGVNRTAVGVGMIPRGEVGLIFARIGHSLTLAGERVIDDAAYAAVVMMVVVTTVITPGALKWALGRRSG